MFLTQLVSVTFINAFYVKNGEHLQNLRKQIGLLNTVLRGATNFFQTFCSFVSSIK